MPITLGCPSCAKRFKARDESAGKKVKCPYCQVAVQVPTPEESASAGAPTGPLPPASGPLPASAPRTGPPGRPAPPPVPAAPVVASPDDWGALPTGPVPKAPPPAPPPAPEPQRDEEPFPPMPNARGKDRPKPAKFDKDSKRDKDKDDKDDKDERGEKRGKGDRPPKAKEKDGAKAPEQVAASGWRSVRSGLFWVQFALLWLALIGFIGFGKAVYTRSVGELPKGDGADWVSIEGYVNSGGINSVPLSKTDLMNLGLYGIPVFFAGVCVVLGRLIASGAPRSSGARGMFAFSAMFALLGLAALYSSFAFERLLMKDEYKYTWLAFLLLMPLAEFWFLTGLTASGLALKRPRAARAVGAVGFCFALVAFVATLGWDLYVEHSRPKKPDDELKLFEQGALMLGWLLLVGVYWRAVRNVRSAAKEYLDTVEEA